MNQSLDWTIQWNLYDWIHCYTYKLQKCHLSLIEIWVRYKYWATMILAQEDNMWCRKYQAEGKSFFLQNLNLHPYPSPAKWAVSVFPIFTSVQAISLSHTSEPSTTTSATGYDDCKVLDTDWKRETEKWEKSTK